jgi:glycerophosphoryl diester phosphodiesterase
MNHNFTSFLLLILSGLFLSPTLVADQITGSKTIATNFDLQGHRGARGVFPENTIPAFLYALDLGVTTLEMDVVVNAEGTVYLSHEPWFSAEICSQPDGRKVTKKDEKELMIYTMSNDVVNSFDCGSRGHSDFPQQQAMPLSKPTLNDVFDAVESQLAESGRAPVRYNIEIKSSADGDGITHPEVAEYARLLYELVQQNKLVERTSIQSFDTRALEATRALDSDISIVFLTDNINGLQKNLALLSFKPNIYSPRYSRLCKKKIKVAHAQNILVIPWTVNKEKAMRKLIGWGIDGLITDYPELGLRVLTEMHQTQ